MEKSNICSMLMHNNDFYAQIHLTLIMEGLIYNGDRPFCSIAAQMHRTHAAASRVENLAWVMCCCLKFVHVYNSPQ
jgi:hypothetical protein